METIKLKDFNVFSSSLNKVKIDEANKIIISTINAHSYIVAKHDSKFRKALVESDILLPDGEGIVMMAKKIKNLKIKKIAGADIHNFLLEKANKYKLKCFYLGASQETLDLIKKNLSKQYPNIRFDFFSPSFKSEFSIEETNTMISRINTFSPSILFVGMTAPKQEKWVLDNKNKINANVICSIGAVFDFIAGTKNRAPQWIINLRLEWLYRSFTEWRLTKRYLYSTPLFLLEVFKLKYFKRANKQQC